MKPTIRDIAEACQVSKTTVSRFLNNSGYVSKDVADRITAKIKELNYVPSSTARNLSLQRSNVIGLVVPEVSNPFFGEIFKGISDVADLHQMSILYCNTDNNRLKEIQAFEKLRSQQICGLIITPATGGLNNGSIDTEFLRHIEALDVPFVLLDRDVEYKEWPGVFTDSKKGAYEGTKLLIDNGHKFIATIHGDLSLLIGKERLEGYQQALKAHDLYNEDFIFEGDFSINRGYEQMLKIIEHHPEISAVFSPNNLTTMGILKALQEKNLKMPEDIAVVGFDDIELLSLLGLNLSVIQRNPKVMGEKAIGLLVDMIKNKNHHERLILQPEMIIRGSEKNKL